MKKTLLFTFLIMGGLFLSIQSFGQAMPAAITITPEGATAFDEITLTFDANQACVPEGKESLLGLESVAMHSALKVLGEDWADWGTYGVDYNGTPGGDYDTRLTSNGDGTFSKTFIPALYYGVTEDDGIFVAISAVFNNGNGWDAEGKDQGDGECTDFKIPLSYTSTDPVGNFNVNMNKMIDDGNFIAGLDKVWLVIDGLGEYDMIDLDAEFNADGIYFVKIESLLEQGTEYTYSYRINNDTPEEVTRTFTAQGGPNAFNDWWNDDRIIVAADLTINLNVAYEIANGTFVPETDYIDVAGAFNGWGPAEGEYVLTQTNDSIYTINIPELEAATNYEFKFRINSNWDTSEFPGGGPNRLITPNEGEQTMEMTYNTALIFTVDMTSAVDAGTFDPETDFVDVAGDMNGWSGSAKAIAQGNNVYKINIYSVYVGQHLGYKFRINANWDTSEYPGGGANREYDVVYGDQYKHHFYDTEVSVKEISDQLNEIRFFPNPVNNTLMIQNASNASRIIITNMVGQNVYDLQNPASTVSLETSNWNNGMYFITFVEKNGVRRVEKIIKN